MSAAPAPASDDSGDAGKPTDENTGICASGTGEAQNAPPPSGRRKLPLPKSFPGWAMWAIGALVLLAIPFRKRLVKAEGVLEKVVKAVADDVEAAAPIVKMLAEEISESLPEDSAIARELEIIENMADEVAEHAEAAEAFVEKMEDIRAKVEDAVQPIIDKQEVKTATTA